MSTTRPPQQSRSTAPEAPARTHAQESRSRIVISARCNVCARYCARQFHPGSSDGRTASQQACAFEAATVGGWRCAAASPIAHRSRSGAPCSYASPRPDLVGTAAALAVAHSRCAHAAAGGHASSPARGPRARSVRSSAPPVKRRRHWLRQLQELLCGRSRARISLDNRPRVP